MAKFLIVRFSSIGDIVLTTPVIRCLKQQVKDAEVHFITKKCFSSVIDHNPYIDKKIYLEDDLSKLIIALKKEKYDFIIDLHNNLRTLYLKTKLGVKSFTFNKINIEKWMVVNFKIDRLPHMHIVDRYMETVKSLGVVNDGKGLEYFITQEDGLAIQKLPPQFKNGYVAFVIGAKHNTKKLPIEKIVSICKKISPSVVLLGGKDDDETGKKIQNEIGTVFNACGKFSLNESAALIKHAGWVITHDTGLMHIAAAFKKKIVSVWGNTIPEFGMYPYYGDFEIKNQKVEIKNLNCRPCSKLGFHKCPKSHFRCMKDIDEMKITTIINTND